MAVFYPAIITREQDLFSVSFPDIPGCYSQGDTANEAAINGEHALSLHLYVAAKEKILINPPSEVDGVKKTIKHDYVTCVLIRGEIPGQKVRIQVSMDDDLLKQIARVTKNRSKFLADAAFAKLAA